MMTWVVHWLISDDVTKWAELSWVNVLRQWFVHQSVTLFIRFNKCVRFTSEKCFFVCVRSDTLKLSEICVLIWLTLVKCIRIFKELWNYLKHFSRTYKFLKSKVVNISSYSLTCFSIVCICVDCLCKVYLQNKISTNMS